MNCQKSTHSDTVDELLSLLANKDCRATLAYLRDSPDDELTLDALADELVGSGVDDQTHVVPRLHHETLPRLDVVDALEYDPERNTVRYRGHDELETMLDSVEEAVQRMD